MAPDGTPSSWVTCDSTTTDNGGYSSLPEVLDRTRGDTWKVYQPPSDPGLEVKRPDEKEVAEDFAYGLDVRHVRDEGEHSNPEPRSERKRRRGMIWLCAVILLLIGLGVGLGVGLGLGLGPNETHHTSANTQSNSTATIQPSGPDYLSKRGAFNGTAVSVMEFPYLVNLTSGVKAEGVEGMDNLVLVFQHHTGQIRWMQRLIPDKWSGGSAYDVVADDAKNATPIALRYNALGQHHVFYINSDNLLRQRVIDNQTYTWFDGPLNDLNIKTLNADRVGLQVCFYSGPIDNVDLDGTQSVLGLRLYIATDETTFDQYAWRVGMPNWIWEQSWVDMNGHADPGCYTLDPDSTTYAMFVDKQNDVQMYWRDTSENAKSTSTHPLNSWVKSSLAFPKVHPETGLDYHNNLYARVASTGEFHGWNITFDAENTGTTATIFSSVDGDPPTPNTHFYVWSVPPTGPPKENLLFYQTKGDDITQLSGDFSTGEWTQTMLPIPDD